ncbi:MAG: hypothetical protein H7321_00630 [Bacteroidia bacterium]|nr:hypothetical protein [Bacteroidia bacterium]
MVKEISINELKKKLRDIFCSENKANKKYSEVWLSDADFGGLYQSHKYIVNVKAEHLISSCNDEIKYIITNLFKGLSTEELEFVWRVVVFNSNEQVHCESVDILIYSEEVSCES